MKRLMALLAVMVLFVIYWAVPASAATSTCVDLVSPVTLSAGWNTAGDEVKLLTKSPLASTYKIYVQPNMTGPFLYIGYTHRLANQVGTIYFITTDPGNYVSYSWPDAGSSWHNPAGGAMSYCRSPGASLYVFA